MIRALPLCLVGLAAACSPEPKLIPYDDNRDADIEEWFDFSTLNDPPEKPTGPKVCRYSIRMNGHLLDVTKNRNGGLRSIMTPCSWTPEGLDGYVWPGGEICPKSTDKRFNDLYVSGPIETSLRDLPDSCYDSGIVTSTEFQYAELAKSQGAYSVCFRTNNKRNTNSPADGEINGAAIEASFWRSDFGLPIEQISVAEDTVEIVINPQFPAWKLAWEDVIFSWLDEAGYEPGRVACPT